ncbi:MAG: TIGR03435 family protein [Bryobacteraceae bacterium]|jgi:uncharacterized protein (TIGR03435 family)
MRSAIVALLLISPLLHAQTAEQKPTFAVASIKLDPKADGADSEPGPGLLRAQMTLARFIATAYDVKPYQVTGGPNWIDAEHYDILAKLEHAGEEALPPDSTPRQRADANSERLRLALQALLDDRFQLKFHRETKEMPCYALTVAKGGFKLQESPNTGEHGTQSKSNGNGRTLVATGVDMGRLVAFLARQVDRPVVDMTHIQGLYDFTLAWTPNDLKAAGASDQPALPSLFTALQEKLGLKLESQRALVELLVIDNAERPSEN